MRRARGFTLIEVLVATAVLALGLGAFISSGARYADYARYIHDRTVAQWVAHNQLVQYQITPSWPATGKRGGDVRMGGNNWHWTADIQNSPDPTVRRIDLRVYRIDPDSHKPEADSVTLLSGFVTRHLRAPQAPGAADAARANVGTSP